MAVVRPRGTVSVEGTIVGGLGEDIGVVVAQEVIVTAVVGPQCRLIFPRSLRGDDTTR